MALWKIFTTYSFVKFSLMKFEMFLAWCFSPYKFASLYVFLIRENTIAGNSQHHCKVLSFRHCVLDSWCPSLWPPFFVTHAYFYATLVKISYYLICVQLINHESGVLLSFYFYIIFIFDLVIPDNLLVCYIILSQDCLNLFDCHFLVWEESFVGQRSSLFTWKMCQFFIIKLV